MHLSSEDPLSTLPKCKTSNNLLHILFPGFSECYMDTHLPSTGHGRDDSWGKKPQRWQMSYTPMWKKTKRKSLISSECEVFMNKFGQKSPNGIFLKYAATEEIHSLFSHSILFFDIFLWFVYVISMVCIALERIFHESPEVSIKSATMIMKYRFPFGNPFFFFLFFHCLKLLTKFLVTLHCPFHSTIAVMFFYFNVTTLKFYSVWNSCENFEKYLK